MQKLENHKVGFFDSGLGGLGLLRYCEDMMSSHHFFYIGDQKFHPYGSRSDRDVIERSCVLTEKLAGKGCDIIVVACNSATAVAIDFLREKYSHLSFVGIEPYLNVLQKNEFSSHDKIGALVTDRTFRSQRLKQLKSRVDSEGRLEVMVLDKLAPFIEEQLEKEHFDYEEMVKILSPIKGKGFDYLILGCTHYPLVSRHIEEYLNVTCLDPAVFVIKRLRSLLGESPLGSYEKDDLSGHKESFLYCSTRDETWREESLKSLLPSF